MWFYERPMAHRGYRLDGAPENSREAFKKAIEKGYNVELDVHLLKSGEVVVFHDETLKRMCGKKVRINSLTLDDIKSDKYLLPNGEHIPLLEEVLKLFDGKNSGIMLELKIQITHHKLEKAVYQLIKGKEDFVVVNGFSPYAMRWFRKNAPEFHQGFVSCGTLFPISRFFVKGVAPDFLSFGIRGINKYIMNYAKKHNFGMVAWTIDNEKKLDKVIKYGLNSFLVEKIDLEKLGFSMEKLPKR